MRAPPRQGERIHAVEQQATLDEALLNAGGAQRAWAMLTVDELGAAVVPFDRLGDQRVQPLLLIRGELLVLGMSVHGWTFAIAEAVDAFAQDADNS